MRRVEALWTNGVRMSDIALPGSIEPAARKRPDLGGGIDPLTGILFGGVVAAVVLFVAYSVYSDIGNTGAKVTSYAPFLLLFVALLIALGFEFVNGFHDTANAVATVIYTRSLPANFAVVWSGTFNLLGVLASSGAVAFGIISLLPVELILQVGSHAGFAMVFALLIAAIIWNLGTWVFGLPASSSHTLIGSIIGVGITNALLHGRSGTSGVDWSKAKEVGEALLFSPLFGFALAAVLLLALKFVVRIPALYAEPKGDHPPPWWIRGILILTCTLVSFFHGSNDGQKGMGLIMLILIGTVPTAYALNRAMPDSQLQTFASRSLAASAVIEQKAAGYNVLGNPRPAVTAYVASHELNDGTYPSLAVLVRDISQPGHAIRVARQNAGGDGRQHPQRHVSRLGSDPPPHERQGERPRAGRDQNAKCVQAVARRGDQVHSILGQGGGGHRARPWHHGGLEAHRHHGRRENRQDAFDLRARRLRRDHRRCNDRGRRHLRTAGFDHPRAVVRHRRHHVGERLRAAAVDRAQHRAGLGADIAGGHGDFRHPLLGVLGDLLSHSQHRRSPRS